MNAVEIEQAISELAEKPFDRQEFPFQFLEAFGNKETTLKRLRTGVSNKSDLAASFRPTTSTSPPARPARPRPPSPPCAPAPPRLRARHASSWPPMAKRWRLKTSPLTTHPLPVPIPISTTTSASSCRWQASPPSSRSAKAPLTSRRPAA